MTYIYIFLLNVIHDTSHYINVHMQLHNNAIVETYMGQPHPSEYRWVIHFSSHLSLLIKKGRRVGGGGVR